MQFKQNTIRILDARGQIIATMALPANIKLTELAPFEDTGRRQFQGSVGRRPIARDLLRGVL